MQTQFLQTLAAQVLQVLCVFKYSKQMKQYFVKLIKWVGSKLSVYMLIITYIFCSKFHLDIAWNSIIFSRLCPFVDPLNTYKQPIRQHIHIPNSIFEIRVQFDDNQDPNFSLISIVWLPSWWFGCLCQFWTSMNQNESISSWSNQWQELSNGCYCTLGQISSLDYDFFHGIAQLLRP